jgi:topoisomerase-4 subunit A
MVLKDGTDANLPVQRGQVFPPDNPWNEDISKLLSVKIRRISQFDIEAHRAEMGDIELKMAAVRKSLGSLKQYAVGWLQGLVKKYGKLFPRRTRVETFTETRALGFTALIQSTCFLWSSTE